jgi:hypothetical protein
MPVVAPEKVENGAICLTPEMLKSTMDSACAEGYANGYAKAKAEIAPRADVELNKWDSAEQIMAFLKNDQSDRCSSSVPGEDPSLACLDRAESLTHACRIAGMDSYGVVMNFQGDGSHAIVAFPMKNGTVQFVEPWYDKIVPTPEVGKAYRPDSIYIDMSTMTKTGGSLIVEKIGIFY